jgi:hypothetical protein
MADGALNVSLAGPLAEDIRAAAEASGMSPEEYVRQSVSDRLNWEQELSGLDVEEDVRRLSEAGEDIPAEQFFAEFRAEIKNERNGRS